LDDKGQLLTGLSNPGGPEVHPLAGATYRLWAECAAGR
jgi:hypothetical protein